jgi:serine/threonine protein kinase
MTKEIQVFNTIHSDPMESVDFKFQKKLGRGGFGTVSLASSDNLDYNFSVKHSEPVIDNDEMAYTQLVHMFNEFCKGKNLKHD